MNGMNRMLWMVATLLLVLCALQPASAAGDPFIGAWQLNSSLSKMPEEMKVESKGGNTYAFYLGGGPETIVVDGSDQRGYGGTLLSVKPEAADTWVVQRKKDGRLQLTATWKLSKDGNTLTDYYRQFNPDGSTLSEDFVFQRNGGGSGFVADWQSTKETFNSPYILQVKAYGGDGLSFATPWDERTKNLKFDGKDYPDGTNSPASAALQRVDERNLVITDKGHDKVVYTENFALSPDLKTLTVTLNIPGRDKPYYVMVFDRG